MTEDTHEGVLSLDSIAHEYDSDEESICTTSSMKGLIDSSSDGGGESDRDDLSSSCDSDYDPSLFEDYDSSIFEEDISSSSTVAPLRAHPVEAVMFQLFVMSMIQYIANASMRTTCGSHEGRVPVTDDGNPGKDKIKTHNGTPMPKPSDDGADDISEDPIMLVNILWTFLSTLMSMLIIAGELYPYLVRTECLLHVNQDRYLLAADKEGPKKGRVKRSAAALRQFLAGLIQLPRGITVDSGAADSVFPSSWLRRILLCASPGSIAGFFYVAASGTRIANLGQFLLRFTTRDGHDGSMLFQVASVNKALASVSHLTDIGFCVVFNKHEGRDVSYLMHKDTNTLWKLRRERGVFVLDAFLSTGIGPRNDRENRRSEPGSS